MEKERLLVDSTEPLEPGRLVKCSEIYTVHQNLPGCRFKETQQEIGKMFDGMPEVVVWAASGWSGYRDR